MIFSVLPLHLFVKFSLKTTLKVLHNVKSFFVFLPSLLTPANTAKISRISSSLLRSNYFHVWGRIEKTKVLQRLNVEVNIWIYRFNALIFNTISIDRSNIIRTFVM